MWIVPCYRSSSYMNEIADDFRVQGRSVCSGFHGAEDAERAVIIVSGSQLKLPAACIDHQANAGGRKAWAAAYLVSGPPLGYKYFPWPVP